MAPPLHLLVLLVMWVLLLRLMRLLLLLVAAASLPHPLSRALLPPPPWCLVQWAPAASLPL
jgi:hypothetical protein